MKYNLQQKKKKILHRQQGLLQESSSLSGTLSRRGLNQIMLAYDPRQPDGRPHNGQRL